MEKTTRRTVLQGALGALVGSVAARGQSTATVRYARFEHRGRTTYGVVEGDLLRELRGTPFGAHKATGTRYRLSDVNLLAPCEPRQVLAIGFNYKSHLGSAEPPKKPELFFKTPSCILNPNGRIVYPDGARNVHYEGELVVVIGRRARNVPAEQAASYVFGVTCGNDVSERDWQRADLQWWRAKGSDTFGPLGPVIVTGLDYGKLHLQTRLNGQVKQSQVTSDLLFDVPTIISFVSRHVTLLPGDVIYTGTPGQTSPMKSGDVVEIEIEGIGTLRNTIA